MKNLNAQQMERLLGGSWPVPPIDYRFCAAFEQAALQGLYSPAELAAIFPLYVLICPLL